LGKNSHNFTVQTFAMAVPGLALAPSPAEARMSGHLDKPFGFVDAGRSPLA